MTLPDALAVLDDVIADRVLDARESWRAAGASRRVAERLAVKVLARRYDVQADALRTVRAAVAAALTSPRRRRRRAPATPKPTARKAVR